MNQREIRNMRSLLMLRANLAVRRYAGFTNGRAQGFLGMHPLGRLGEPGHIPSVICRLLSTEQWRGAGRELQEDGGRSKVKTRLGRRHRWP